MLRILKIALKPGKPAVVGPLGNAIYLGLPGNSVAALVSWLLLGAAVTAKLRDEASGVVSAICSKSPRDLIASPGGPNSCQRV